MVMGCLSALHLSKDEGATVYGLKSDERSALVRELNSSFGMSVATANESERTVRVAQKGLTLVLVNRIHGLLGYDVVSHAMAMTNANRELISFTMYKKTSPNSHGQAHGQTHGQTHGQAHSQAHGHGHSSSHKNHPKPAQAHSSVVTL
ncbi:jg17967 [Pararge aegeria aegeria]|uniref:Jg17967 protein n=2 Tax=Pararge aegeria TaxID=116150 RepID=A0A8S4S538_9NEOP|nr:jg17967 [Pararge aegeria aegeria]